MNGNLTIDMCGYKNSMNVSKKPVRGKNFASRKNAELHPLESMAIGERGVHLQLGKYRGEARCDIRHHFYEENQKKWLPTRKGVSMRTDELIQMNDVFPEVYKIMETCIRSVRYGIQDQNSENDSLDKLFAIGTRGIKMKVSGHECSIKIHLRYFEYDDVKGVWYPTKKGVTLNYSEALCIKNLLPKLVEKLKSNYALDKSRIDDSETSTKRLKIEDCAGGGNETDGMYYQEYNGEYIADYDTVY